MVVENKKTYFVLALIVTAFFAQTSFAEPVSFEVYEKKMSRVNKYLDKIETQKLGPQKSSTQDPAPKSTKTLKSVKSALDKIEFQMYTDYQFATGHQSFVVVDSTGSRISRLTYPTKGSMIFLGGEVSKTNSPWSIGGRYGTSLLKQDTFSDEDWGFWDIHNSALAYIDYQETKSRSKNKQSAFDVNIYYQLLNIKNKTIGPAIRENMMLDSLSLDIFLGYQQQQGRYTMLDPTYDMRRTIGDTRWYATDVPFDMGLNSFYKIRYRGPRLGARLAAGRGDWLFSTIALSYAYLYTDAHGWWNLRDYHFSQKGKGGHGLNLDIKCRIYPIKNWFLGAGFNLAWSKQSELKESGSIAGVTYSDENIIRDAKNVTWGPSVFVGVDW